MSPPQADTRVYGEAYFSYVEDVNPRRTQRIGKRAISGWKLIISRCCLDSNFSLKYGRVVLK
jgi:hypothetical protein